MLIPSKSLHAVCTHSKEVLLLPERSKQGLQVDLTSVGVVTSSVTVVTCVTVVTSVSVAVTSSLVPRPSRGTRKRAWYVTLGKIPVCAQSA